MAGRRNNNEGTLTKRSDGRWEARVSLPDGGRKSFYGKTKDEAKQKMKQALRDIDAGLPIVVENQTVCQFLENWIAVKKPYWRYNTWRQYCICVRVHIIPALGSISLNKLTAQQSQAFIAELYEEGLSSTTIRQIYVIFKGALKEAQRLGLVQRNVLDLVKSPRRAHHEMVTLSEKQVSRLVAGVEGDWFEALYVLAITTGMREGELLGLRWQDIDFEQGELLVRMAVKVEGVRLVLSETKTDHSRRRIALTQVALAALRRHRVMQNERRLQLGPHWDDSLGLVFPNTFGRMMNPNNFRSQNFKGQLRRLELPDIRFHDLRHTCATLLLSRGVNVKVVSEMLGHASVTITLQIYAHVLPHMQQMAIQRMDAIFQADGKLSSDLSSGE